MKSVIFFDIDGTIISEDGLMAIPESTKYAIAETRKNGNLTFINTGRTRFNINNKVYSLGFDGIICGCGTYIEYENKVLLHNELSHEFCTETAEMLRECGVTPVYEYRDGYFFDDKLPKSKELNCFLESFVEEGISIDGRVEDDNFVFDKFVAWKNDGCDINKFYREISKNFEIIDRGNNFFENVPLGFSKATAVDIILNYLNIPIENAYAIGDSPNDLPMLKAVPNSIAMGGAEIIYPYVSYITSSLSDNGIYNALKHFDLI